jgi:adenine/guanine/hypoxanthine permease
VLTADGVVSLIGCLMGNPFINAVYIGHPGWKAMGGRIGYSAATGVMVLVLCWFGIISVMLARAGRRDLADPALHRHADRRAGLPGDAAQPRARRSCSGSCRTSPPGRSCRSTARSAAAGTNAARSVSTSSRRPACSTTASKCWAAARSSAGWCWRRSRLRHRARIHEGRAFSLAGAVLTFFGFMHGEAIGIGQTPAVAVSYLIVGAFLLTCSKVAVMAPKPAEHGGVHGGAMPAK